MGLNGQAGLIYLYNQRQGAESGSSYSTLYWSQLEKITLGSLTVGGFLLEVDVCKLLKSRVGHFPLEGCCDLENQESVMWVWSMNIFEPVARTGDSCSSGRSSHFKKEKKVRYRAKLYLVETFFSSMRVLKHIPQSTPTVLLIEWLY